ncbi:hypothetical protein HT031_000155 [Scenedesmus sp. PABB004]|nr:hypothetical protein HT031_000155 [Scenedesmus sp. PABB004]
MAHRGASGFSALPRPPSMLFDLEMEDAGQAATLDAESCAAVLAVRALVARALGAAARVVADVEAAAAALAAAGAPLDAAGLAARLAAAGWRPSVRESLGGGEGGACLRNLRHACVVLAPRGGGSPGGSPGGGGEAVIVDPTFRDQFAIAHPSPRYAAVLDALPPVWVGSAPRLAALVELVCGEMVLAFRAAGAVLPPWRQTASMLSKWQPRRSVDLPLPAPGPPGGPGAAPPAAPAAHPRVPRVAAPAQSPHGLLRGGAPAAAPARAGCAAFGSAAASSGASTGSALAGSALAGSSTGSSCSGARCNTGVARALLLGPEPGSAAAGQALSRLARQVSAGCGSRADEGVPARRQVSEPLQRVVGGFAASVAARGPLVL